MKYCPFCGAVLPDEKISFCLECGEKLSELAPGNEQKKNAKKVMVKDKKHKLKNSKKPKREPVYEELPETVSDDYDGYYDDVAPKDSAILHQGLDKGMIKKLAILIVCVIAAIALCVVALVLLN